MLLQLVAARAILFGFHMFCWEISVTIANLKNITSASFVQVRIPVPQSFFVNHRFRRSAPASPSLPPQLPQ